MAVRHLLKLTSALALMTLTVCQQPFPGPPVCTVEWRNPSKSSTTLYTVYKDQVYQPGGNYQQSLNLYIPNGATGVSPVVVVYTIAGFMFGNKDEFMFPGSPTTEAPVGFLQQGYAVAVVNVRYAQCKIWPAQVEDAIAVVRWLRANAERYHLHPTKLAVVGGSAGGYLATMVGVACNVAEFQVGDNLEYSGCPAAVVTKSTPTSFLTMDEECPCDVTTICMRPDQTVCSCDRHDTPESPESTLLFNGTATLSSDPELVARASPLTYVTKNAPPFLILHGAGDLLVPPHQSVLLYDKLVEKKAHDDTLVVVARACHVPALDSFPMVQALQTDFLDTHLRGGQ